MLVAKDSVIIKGSKGEDILIDIDWYDRLIINNWNCYGGYARTFSKVNGKLISESMHRVVMGIIPEGLVVDHINGNKLDNRMVNLRTCTVAENSRNRKVSDNTKNTYLGVTFHKRDRRWQAQVRHKGIRYYCGYFKTEKEAAVAYDKKAKELHKEFANLNFKEKLNE